MDIDGITLSVVIPMYNEEAVLPLLAARLRPVLDGLGEAYEVVAVDDGSRDSTAAQLMGMRRLWPQLRVIRLRRNGGHQAALTAGLARSVGEYVVSLDADLQDPPEKIPEMLALARRDGLDIVYGVRGDRSTDTRYKRWTAGIYYKLMRRLIGKNVTADAGDFRLLSRQTVNALLELPNSGGQVLRLLVPWIGFPSGQVAYVREERAAGRTKYPLSKMLLLTLDSVTSFSAAPLRLATMLGLCSVILCGILLITGLFAYVLHYTVSGWASLYISILFLGAVQLLCLGLLGEYIGRIYTTVQGRPTYFVGYDSADETADELVAVR
ncbi:glycosyltransferase family 2 protein [Dactylosporangium sp. NPDC000555]|uniref:glycosyltransferase family 2 protein n=1 Tax=Dactylosporangium sp. NPDC000555 TaxID=3154260 RepID=UPI00332C80C9